MLVSAGYLTALVMLWGNRGRPWFPLLIAGTALNTLVILMNGGWMPIVPAALAGAGEPLPAVLADGRVMIEVDPRHFLAGRGTPLAVLGDSIPMRFGGVGAVMSPGDILMAAGIAGFLQAAMRIGAPGQRA